MIGLWELNAKKLPARNVFDLLKSLFANTFFKIACN